MGGFGLKKKLFSIGRALMCTLTCSAIVTSAPAFAATEGAKEAAEPLTAQAVYATQPGQSTIIDIANKDGLRRLYTLVTPAVGNTAPHVVYKGAYQYAVDVPAGARQGDYQILFYLHPVKSLKTANMRPVGQVRLQVSRPGSLLPYFNNVGIGLDNAPLGANFDGSGNSYSTQQLAAAGLTPGKPVNFHGFHFTWPNDFPARPDNIIAKGQTIPLSGRGRSIGFLGAATNGNSHGVAVVHYTNGTWSTVLLGFTDWTMNGGLSVHPSFSNWAAATTHYRDSDGGRTNNHVFTYVFFTQVPVKPGLTVSSVTLPKTVYGGNLHVFSMAVGN